ncbi:MAG: dienelactone hydrolase family protein [Lentisphaerae bacterium]|nr:dienelactone hydrolase family protein [Lentisphaerota bacterium]
MHRRHALSILILAAAIRLTPPLAAGELPYADSPDRVRPLDVGDSVPDAALTTLDGKTVRLTDVLADKPTILVYFRGGWCPYCVKHLAGLQQVHEQLKAEGYQLVAISPDGNASVSKAAQANGLDYTLLGDPKMEAIREAGLAYRLDRDTMATYKGLGIELPPAPEADDILLPVPALYLVNAKGQITYRHYDPDYTRRLAPDRVVAAARLTLEVIEYRDDGKVYQGYLARPRRASESSPAVLVVHEWWGINDYTRERARQLAEAGYVAFAADMYGKGRRSDTFEGAGKLAGELKGDRPLIRHRGETALQVLRAQPGVDTNRVAAIGYCLGGLCVLEFARGGTDLAGVVSYHGGLDTPLPAKPGDVRARVLICHGASDPYEPAADIVAIQKELTDAGADWQFISYGGAVHGFTNPHNGSDPSQGLAYNPAADRRSWQATLDFFAEIFAK